jgi:hypothetical protein
MRAIWIWGLISALAAVGAANAAGNEVSQNYQTYQAAQVQLELSGANKLTSQQVDQIKAQHYQFVSSADGYFVVDPIRGLSSLIAHQALYWYYTSQHDQSFTFDFGDGSSVVLGSEYYRLAHDCFLPIKTPPGCSGSFSVAHIYAAAGSYAVTVKNASGTVVDSLTVYVP